MYRFRWIISILTLAALLIPFIFQQTFYPFFRFGMFAEPIKRSIQTEQFFLAVTKEDGMLDLEIAEATGIEKSTLEYLLRNYYYRNESEQFLKQVVMFFPEHQIPDTLFIIRKLENDTSVVASFPVK